MNGTALDENEIQLPLELIFAEALYVASSNMQLSRQYNRETRSLILGIAERAKKDLYAHMSIVQNLDFYNKEMARLKRRLKTEVTPAGEATPAAVPADNIAPVKGHR